MKQRREGAGYSVPAAAEALGVSYKTLRNAIELGQVNVVNFGGLMRISSAEVKRIKQMFDDSTSEDPSDFDRSG